MNDIVTNTRTSTHRIWEKKFGSKAKHKQKERELDAQEAKRKADLKAERLAKRAGKVRLDQPEGPDLGKATGRTPQTVRPGRSEHNSKEATASKPLHPAWEAKLKMKQMEAAVMTARPQGKRIVFS